MPREATTGQHSVKALAKAAFNNTRQTSTPTNSIQKQAPADTASHPETTGYTIVIASHVSRKNAQSYTADLNKRGYDQANVYTHAGRTKIVYGLYATRQEAQKVLNRLNKIDEFNSCWITRLK